VPAPEPTTRQSAAAAPTRVLFLIYGLQPAGPELRLLEFARHFPETIELHICVIGDDLTMLEEFQKTRAKITHVPVRRPYAEWGQTRKIANYIREHDIRIVNSFDLKTLLVALSAKLRVRRRLKLVHHLISLWDGVRGHQRTVIWQALRFTDVIVCNGYAVKEGVIGSRRMRVPVLVIANGVDCDHFRPSPELRRGERERLGYTPNDVVLGTVANVRPVKNYPLLLRGMRRLADAFPNVRLLCVGGGPQLAEMRRLADELQLGHIVRFVGQARDVRPWVATFDIFALCSLKEGCPNALMQAMAMGIASVSSDVGEVRHLTNEGSCGLMFPSGDVDTFVAQASKLVRDELYRCRLAQAGRERMQEVYDNPRMINAYAALYERLQEPSGVRGAA
jgi:glycosyltransferase involved in cell wall biosynthesis